MSVKILMPALSPTMTEGKIVRWLNKVGDNISAGDIIVEIETDKATMEVEASESGILEKILIDNGSENIAVNTPIAIITGDTEVQPGAPQKKPMLQVENKEILLQNLPIPTSQALDNIKKTYDSNLIRKITVREGIRDAIAEEMRFDNDVFLIGEEVAQYEGAYKVSQGLLDEFGQARVIDTPITENNPFSSKKVKQIFHKNKKIKILIAVHDLYDAPNSRGGMTFLDFHEWLVYLRDHKVSKKYDFY